MVQIQRSRQKNMKLIEIQNEQNLLKQKLKNETNEKTRLK